MLSEFKASELGHSRAQCNLGFCYDKDKGVAQSHEKAFEWYEKAADQGYPLGQYNFGYCYDKGKGVESYEKAFHWYQKVAGQGYAEAQGNLGNCYQTGRELRRTMRRRSIGTRRLPIKVMQLDNTA